MGRALGVLTVGSALRRGRSRGGAAAAGFLDTFDRADQWALGTSSDGTKSWAVPDAVTTYPASPGTPLGWRVYSNAAGVGFQSNFMVAYVAGLGAGGRAKVTVKTPSTLHPWFILARYADHSNYVGLKVGPSGSSSQSLELFKQVSGVRSSLLSVNVDFVNVNAGDTLELEVTSGDLGRIYWNGVQQGATVNSGLNVLTGNTAWGMAIDPEGETLSAWDGALEQYEWNAG